MDVVDIDKVLNDFEMNEDRIFKENKPDISASKTEKNFKPNPTPEYIQRSSSGGYDVTGNRSSRNISNMLMSLDEYISADINTDIEVQTPYTYTEPLQSTSETDDTQSKPNNNEQENTVQSNDENIVHDESTNNASNESLDDISESYGTNSNPIDLNAQMENISCASASFKADVAISDNSEIENNIPTKINETQLINKPEDVEIPTHSAENCINENKIHEIDSINGKEEQTVKNEIIEPIKPVSFNEVADVSQSELESYLDELEELEPTLATKNDPTEDSDSDRDVVKHIVSEDEDKSDLYYDNENTHNSDVDDDSSEVGFKNDLKENSNTEDDIKNIDSQNTKCDNEFNTNSVNGNKITDVNGNSKNPLVHASESIEINKTSDQESTSEEINSEVWHERQSQSENETNLCDIGKAFDNENPSSSLVPLVTNEENGKNEENELFEDDDSCTATLDISEDQNSITTLDQTDISLHKENSEALQLDTDATAASASALAGTSPSRSEFDSSTSEEHTHNSELDSLEDPIPSFNDIQSDSDALPSPTSYGLLQDSSPSSERSNLSNGSINVPFNELGKVQPFWIPDNMTAFCMQCNLKFSFLKRRHHCRACGQVLCSACCSLKAKLEYMNNAEAKICVQCDVILNRQSNSNNEDDLPAGDALEATAANGSNTLSRQSSIDNKRQPNPNNPMEYCSVIPPHQQVASTSTAPSIAVMVPVGVLKRVGNPPKSNRKEKNVIFSDGIRPGCDLSMLDESWDSRSESSLTSSQKYTGHSNADIARQKHRRSNLPKLVEETKSYIPASDTKNGSADSALPPIQVPVSSTEFKFEYVTNNSALFNRLYTEELKFIIQRNFFVLVKIVTLSCCINKTVISFTTHGLHFVGQDEILILLEVDDSKCLPNDIFLHLNTIYHNAYNGLPISELEFSPTQSSVFLGSKEHGGFLYIRPTFQCLQSLAVPEKPYLIGILIHRWEVPWAKIFPLRLMLRLGALYRYYPAPHVSIRGRNSVYAEIAQTIINFLADFRSYSYTLATIQGMYILMENRRTKVLIPRNRYDQVMKALNNSSDYILALAGNFSKSADGHLVCVQNTESGCAETHTYSTQAINIQGKPRKVTGASFLVLNGALKTTSGLSGKCSIVEDGLMVQILPKKMAAIRNALKNMKDVDIVCGPVDADEKQAEIVSILWVENDTEFNIGVKSPIDRSPMDGIPSIRVHHGFDYSNGNHIIRWNEVFIIQSDEESARGKDPIDISKLAENISKSASTALVKYLDLLAANGLFKLGIRATLNQDQVCYEAGSNYGKLPPLYMAALDSELIPTLNSQISHLQLDQKIIIELIFHILNI